MIKYKYSDLLVTKSVYFNHKGKNYNYNLKEHPEYETFLSFDTWKILYNGDRENWNYVRWCLRSRHGAFDDDYWVWLPFYVDKHNKFHFIKFLSRRDYRKYRRFIRKIQKEGEDFENLKEQQELATLVRERANERMQREQANFEVALQKTKQLAQQASVSQPTFKIKETKMPNSEDLFHLTGEFWLDKNTNQIVKIVNN